MYLLLLISSPLITQISNVLVLLCIGLKDLELAKSLARPGSTFVEDLSKMKNFSEEGYGSVTRVFVACTEDSAIYEKTQRWMIENYPPMDLFEIKGSGHMAMFSKTQELCDCLVEIANKYA